MKKIDENTFLKMKALAFAIDKCIMESTNGNDEEFENAMILSEMNIELFKQEALNRE